MYVVPVIGTDDVNENPNVLFVVIVPVTVRAKIPSVVRFVPPIAADFRRAAAGAITPAGIAAAYVIDPPAAPAVAGSVSEAAIPFASAGNETTDALPEIETAVVVAAGSGAAEAITGCWGDWPRIAGELPPPPQPANAAIANAKKTRFVNVRSKEKPGQQTPRHA